MTRKEAIKEINNDVYTMRLLFNAVIGDLCNRCRHNDAEEMEGIRDRLIKRLLEKNKVYEWISVDERLPEKNMACLVAVGKFNLTQIAMYSDLVGIIEHRIFYQGDYGHETFVDITQYVKAWMPLPEPYEAESEVQDDGE